MGSELLLLPGDEGTEDRWQLSDHDDDVLRPVFRELVHYATDPSAAAVVHEREGELIAAYDRDGALRLAQALPPAYTALARRLRDRYGGDETGEVSHG